MVNVGVREDENVDIAGVEGEDAVDFKSFFSAALIQATVEQNVSLA